MLGDRFLALLCFVAMLAPIHGQSCGIHKYQCANGNCISIYNQCNGYNSCGDGSDEPAKCKAPGNPCTMNQFKCTNGNCEDINYVCDGDDDCGDNSDERNCTGPYSPCPIYSFECNNKQCQPLDYVCDGIQDCGSGEEEGTCDTNGVNPCPDYTFLCPSRLTNFPYCINPTWVCDGDNDCGDNADEANCAADAGWTNVHGRQYRVITKVKEGTAVTKCNSLGGSLVYGFPEALDYVKDVLTALNMIPASGHRYFWISTDKLSNKWVYTSTGKDVSRLPPTPETPPFNGGLALVVKPDRIYWEKARLNNKYHAICELAPPVDLDAGRK